MKKEKIVDPEYKKFWKAYNTNECSERNLALSTEKFS